MISSVCGAVAKVQQTGYADKDATQDGEPLSSLNIGYACKKGLKPESPNQDDFCILCADTACIYGVFDGHGPYGHDVSNYVQEALPRLLTHSNLFEMDPEGAFHDAFQLAQRACTQPEEGQGGTCLDCTLSGTTATVTLVRDGYLYVAHVGDSRAVLARSVNGQLLCEDLTVDHRPTLKSEKERIQTAGGQVRRLEGDLQPRVFLAGKIYPGLAITRSIGDMVGTMAGVVCAPSVQTLRIEPDCQFVLLCSDGVWEFIKSQEAVDLVGQYPPCNAHEAAKALGAEAWKRWIEKEGDVVDDLTVVVAWLNEG